MNKGLTVMQTYCLFFDDAFEGVPGYEEKWRQFQSNVGNHDISLANVDPSVTMKHVFQNRDSFFYQMVRNDMIRLYERKEE